MFIDKEQLVGVVSSMLDYQETKIWYVQAKDYVRICTLPIDRKANVTVAEYILTNVPGIKGIEPVHTIDVQASMFNDTQGLQINVK